VDEAGCSGWDCGCGGLLFWLWAFRFLEDAGAGAGRGFVVFDVGADVDDPTVDEMAVGATLKDGSPGDAAWLAAWRADERVSLEDMSINSARPGKHVTMNKEESGRRLMQMVLRE
jgi:hypothetical protein